MEEGFPSVIGEPLIPVKFVGNATLSSKSFGAKTLDFSCKDIDVHFANGFRNPVNNKNHPEIEEICNSVNDTM